MRIFDPAVRRTTFSTHRPGTALLLALALLAGCGSSKSEVTSSDASIKAHLVRGVAQIRNERDRKTLHAQLVRTLAALQGEPASTDSVRRARRLAIQGLAATLNGVRSELAFAENDRGNIEAATRDAKRAYFYRVRGAKLLRAAGRMLGVRIGKLNHL